MQTLTLDKLAIGQKATITTVGGEGILRRRFLDMGLTPKTKVMVRKKAPLGDPIEIFLRGYELTLRLDDANKITVVPEEQALPSPSSAAKLAKAHFSTI
ncbi:MAG: FeoA family protein [Phascolarctobacterium faecium]